MARWPSGAQVCYVPDIRSYVELVQCDDEGDPFFMEHDDLIKARHIGIEHSATWSMRRLRPVTPMSRAMLAIAKAGGR